MKRVRTQLREGSTESENEGINILQKHLFYTKENLKNYLFINIGIFIPNVTWKLTKIAHTLLAINGFLVIHRIRSGNNQRSKLNVELSSISANHMELFYCFTGWFFVYKKNYQTRHTRLCYIRNPSLVLGLHISSPK